MLSNLSAQTAAKRIGTPDVPAKAHLGPGKLVTTAVPTARVLSRVDDGQRSMIYGHVPSALRHSIDKGRLATSTPAQHLVLVLNSSDEQKTELHHVLDQQQDKTTANYHQWVTPEQFGQHFGVHDADIAKVSEWLESHGLQVEDVSKSKRVIHFSGTTGQLESAFKTEIHKVQVGTETHVSNTTDISVPEALRPVISGVTMNDFFRKGHMGPVKHFRDAKQEDKTIPLYSTNTTTHNIGPWDFARIYNTFPLLNKGITGAGSSIAVVGRSDILLSDVQSYRSIFDLPENDPIFIHAGQDNGIEPGDDGESDLDVEISGGIAPNAQVYFVVGTPTFFVDGITNSIEYIVENNTADIMSISYGSCESVEGAGGNAFNNQAFEQAAAQGISVFVAAGDNGPAECDDSNDTYENLGYATGGEASTPYSVSVGGSQFFEGTTAAQEAPYWSTTSQQAPYWGLSAISYVPEVPWNEAKNADKSDAPAADLADLWSGSGGISSYYLLPSWQRGSGVPTADPALLGGDWVTGVNFTNAGSGYTVAPTVTFTSGGCVTEPVATTTISGGAVTGVVFNYGVQGGSLKAGQGFGCTSAPTVTFGAAPAGGTTATATANIGPMNNVVPLISGVPHRYTPDLVLNGASDHDGTFFCSEGICQTAGTGNSVTLVDAGLVGGTSVAAPSMAGIQALINQANGGRQGMPGYIYYALSNAQNESNCNSTLGNAIGSGCVFQDITQGDNLICGTSACAATTGKIGFQAGTGYDLASGLGSVNAANMASQWSSVVFNSSATTLSLSQTSGIPQGTPVTISGTVSSSTGTPTGDVAFIVSSGGFGTTVNVNTGAYSGPGAFATLSNGTYSATLPNLPGGSYTVTARYAGDSTFASSLSIPVPVTVTAGNSTVTLTAGSINQSTCTISTGPGTTLTYGGLGWIPATVAGTSNQGVPTGTVTITVDGATWGTEILDPNGNGYLVAGAVPTSSCLYGYIFSQGPLLTGGTHTIGATYSGDATFSAATATPISITVSPLTVTPALTAGASYIASGASDRLTATFATISALTGITPGIAGPTGTVTFTDTTTGTVLGTASVSDNVSFSGNTYSYSAVASLATTSIITTGANAITATYSGDANFASTTSTAATVTVGTGTATSVAVTSSANPTTLGGRPTFTATVTGATSGSVTFYDGTTVLGTGTVGTAHTATLRLGTAAFVGGSHNITASFGGVSTTYTASTSPVFVETVTQGTAPIALQAKTTGTVGKAFTFAAVLTPTSTSAAYSPNQSVVNFYDGSTLIGSAQPITVTASQGGYGLWTASFTYTGFAAGTHSVTATYTDVNYSLTTSAVQTVKVYSKPVGNLEQAVDSATGSTTILSTDSLFVSGWAADAVDGSSLTSVNVYIDGVLSGAATTGISRPDVASAYNNPAYGTSGYNYSIPASSLAGGTHVVTVIATDSGGNSTTFGPLSVTVSTVYPAPVGNLEQAIDASNDNPGSTTLTTADTLFVSGWAADPTDGSPLANVKVYIDGTSIGAPALGGARPDVATATGNAAYGNSGYSLSYSASNLSAATHTVTVTAINAHGVQSTFGPLTITVTQAAKAPAGNLEQAVDSVTGTQPVSTSDNLFVSGWAADYQANGPAASVVISVDGTVAGNATLGGARPDVATAYNDPGWSNVGWTYSIPASGFAPGTHSVTATATDSTGLTTTFGPITITVQ